MKFVDMCTNEKNIDVHYGMYNLREEREGARGSLKYILRDISDIKKSYFILGFHLNEFRNFKYYEDFGYLTFEEFCENNFDMDKSAISRCINVFLMINAHNKRTYKNGVECVGCAMQILDEYKDFSYSQLCEMLPLDDDKRAKVKPDMTIKQIREMKNKIFDITPEKINRFIDYFRGNINPFTRELLKQHFEKQNYFGVGSEWISFEFKPGKVSIDGSEYYPFEKILKYYESCGGTFESEPVTIDFSSPVVPEPEVPEYVSEDVCFDDNELGSSEFVTALWDCIEDVLDSLCYQLLKYQRSGKSFEIETMKGDKYRLLFMVGKKKESET